MTYQLILGILYLVFSFLCAFKAGERYGKDDKSNMGIWIAEVFMWLACAAIWTVYYAKDKTYKIEVEENHLEVVKIQHTKGDIKYNTYQVKFKLD